MIVTYDRQNMFIIQATDDYSSFAGMSLFLIQKLINFRSFSDQSFADAGSYNITRQTILIPIHVRSYQTNKQTKILLTIVLNIVLY